MTTTGAGGEPFGTTPLPVSQSGSPVRLWFDAETVLERAQQPQTQQIAVFEAAQNDECINGAALDVNQHFCVYAVKKGLIRVLHRHSTLRTLLRGHQEQRVTDIRFFQDGDVLATAATSENPSIINSKVIIWRIFERSPEIMAEKLLEIHTTNFSISRIVWHPFNPNQFWMMHTNEVNKQVATLVETTRITTVAHPSENHAVCDFHTDFIVMDGAVQLKGAGNLTDLCWSQRDTRHVVTVHDNGDIILWDLKRLEAAEDGTVQPACLVTVRNEGPLSRCLFLPHENILGSSSNTAYAGSVGGEASTPCFVTASDKNSTLTLWSPFTESGKLPTKVQIVGLEHPASSYILDVCFGPAPPDASPPSCFIVMADRTAGKIFAFHCRAVWNEQEGKNKRALLTGCDYVVPFRTKFPTYSWSVVCAPTSDISEEELVEQGGLIFDIKLFGYQSAVVQSLTLTSYMCLPPEGTWTDPTPGVRVERLLQVQSAHVSEIGSDEDVGDFEDYELEELEDDDDDDDDDDDEFKAPEASALPSPAGLVSPLSGPVSAPALSNPFANWLGAIASKATGAGPPPMPPPPGVLPLPVVEAPPASALPPPPGVVMQPVVVAPPASALPPPPAPEPQPAQPFLSPLDFLNGKAPTPPKAVSRGSTPVTDNRQELPMATPKPGNMAILKRGDAGTAGTAAALAPSTSAVQVGNQPDISTEIRLAVRAEMQATVLPLLKKMMEESMAKSVTNPIQASIGTLSEQGVTVDDEKIAGALSESLREPLRAAFADSMKTVLIPSLESITGQVLAQVSDRLEKGTTAANSETEKAMEAMSTQLSTLATLVNNLTNEVQGLRASVASRQTTPSVPPAPQAPPAVKAEDARGEVLALLKKRQYEAAFTKAVSSSTADMAVFCCTNADLNDVLGGTVPTLSQPILLCLMQQLGTVLVSSHVSNLQTELAWLQEIALSLNPADESIQRHVPTVLQQVVSSITVKLNQGDQTLRRPLQRLMQVVRGMQMG
jgi:hypothetical protein